MSYRLPEKRCAKLKRLNLLNDAAFEGHIGAGKSNAREIGELFKTREFSVKCFIEIGAGYVSAQTIYF